MFAAGRSIELPRSEHCLNEAEVSRITDEVPASRSASCLSSKSVIDFCDFIMADVKALVDSVRGVYTRMTIYDRYDFWSSVVRRLTLSDIFEWVYTTDGTWHTHTWGIAIRLWSLIELLERNGFYFLQVL
jgi:hypothetical protein